MTFDVWSQNSLKNAVDSVKLVLKTTHALQFLNFADLNLSNHGFISSGFLLFKNTRYCLLANNFHENLWALTGKFSFSFLIETVFPVDYRHAEVLRNELWPRSLAGGRVRARWKHSGWVQASWLGPTTETWRDRSPAGTFLGLQETPLNIELEQAEPHCSCPCCAVWQRADLIRILMSTQLKCLVVGEKLNLTDSPVGWGEGRAEVVCPLRP